MHVDIVTGSSDESLPQLNVGSVAMQAALQARLGQHAVTALSNDNKESNGTRRGVFVQPPVAPKDFNDGVGECCVCGSVFIRAFACSYSDASVSKDAGVHVMKQTPNMCVSSPCL